MKISEIQLDPVVEENAATLTPKEMREMASDFARFARQFRALAVLIETTARKNLLKKKVV